MKFLKSHSSILFVLFFLLPAIQLFFYVGIVFGGLVVGTFPFVTIYFIWLYYLFIEFKKRVLKKYGQQIKVGGIKSLLLLTVLVILPYNLLLTNLLYLDRAPIVFIFLGGILFIPFVYTLIKTWSVLSEFLFILETETRNTVSFVEYKKFFLYFLFGPLTIWFLQPAVVKVLEEK